MRTIGHEELKQMLDRQDDFHLVMALSEWAYQAKHIPGSLHFATSREALQSLGKEDEIVVYCSDENCIASTAFGQLLEGHGYMHVLCERHSTVKSWEHDDSKTTSGHFRRCTDCAGGPGRL